MEGKWRGGGGEPPHVKPEIQVGGSRCRKETTVVGIVVVFVPWWWMDGLA